MYCVFQANIFHIQACVVRVVLLLAVALFYLVAPPPTSVTSPIFLSPMRYIIWFCLMTGLFLPPLFAQEIPVAEDEEADLLDDTFILNKLQRDVFRYFWEGAESHSGMARERIHLDEPEKDAHIVTTGGSGFGLMALLVGIERGYITRAEGLVRFEQIVGFLEMADRFHGAWPHWLDGRTGKVIPFSPQDDGGDLVETSFLVQGLLAVRQYYADGDPQEQKLAQRMDQLWRDVEWDWYQNGEKVLFWHWSPQHGWAMNFRLQGYNEALITYVLAAASPTHPIDPAAYHQGWARKGAIMQPDSSALGLPMLLAHNGATKYGGPLFWAHYSFLGLRPLGLVDAYADYGAHHTDHIMINYRWCSENPLGHTGYSYQCWGLTASYSPDIFYSAHQPQNDLGVITPTAALASMPYTPEQSLAAMRHFYLDLGQKIWGTYGPYDAFHLGKNWYPPHYLAIDQGPIIVMVENYRSELLWKLFMSSPEIAPGLERLGFTSW